jgi:hypothetical protein
LLCAALLRANFSSADVLRYSLLRHSSTMPASLK